LSEYAFSCLATLHESAFRAACAAIKISVHNPTSGETSVPYC
jgi:hypothetical protein